MFHGIVDEEEDNEPEYIESDFGGMIINPKYNINNQLKNAEAKLKQYEEEYIKTQHEYHIDKIKESKQKKLMYRTIKNILTRMITL